MSRSALRIQTQVREWQMPTDCSRSVSAAAFGRRKREREMKREFVLGILFYFRPAWLLGEDRQQADGAASKVRTVSAAAVVCAMVMTVICVIG